jgi:Cu(I)/Ag(I) efflux system membrane fusion protein
MPMDFKRWLLVLIPAATFLVGYWVRGPEGDTTAAARKPLYYVDPMHPSYKSDKPGIAPDCGMQLEPVYAGGGGAGDPADTAPPGAIRLDTRKQQLMGLRTEPAMRSSGRHTLRLLGRVAPNETRIYRVTAQVDGVIRKVSDAAPGNIVRKDDLLASYFVPTNEIFSAIQGFFMPMNTRDQALGLAASDESIAQKRLSQELMDSYGVSETQLREMVRTHQVTRDIEFRSPVTGLVLARNAAIGQRADRGTEVFRIADLSRVWVLADVFEADAPLVHPGLPARVIYNSRTYHCSVTNTPPLFDAQSRTLKERLELDNSDLALRPDMFVDVEFDVQEPEAITVPVEAVIDSGTRKSVFVMTGDGVFEPRTVTTGSRYSDRVAIAGGLKPGDNVVVAGMFLLDSESRLRLAAAAAPPPPAMNGAKSTNDPVCGMDASHADFHSEYRNKTYRFCSATCKAKFDQDPARYAAQP